MPTCDNPQPDHLLVWFISKELRGTRRHQEAARSTWEVLGRQTQTLMTLRGARRSQEEPGGAQEEPRRH